MDENFMLLFDFISLGAGAYCLFTCFKLKLANGRLFSNGILIPKGLEAKDCLDPAGFSAYILPRLLIFAISLTVYGGICMADTLLQFMPFWGRQALIGVALLIIVWYGFVSSKANRLYWDLTKLKAPTKHL